ncbi:MAG: hypothetical protein JRJ77_10310 [Deltaproteobacteria bacterium]|nr:hypothetical protein [Deltaproteobacteria bacterium]
MNLVIELVPTASHCIETTAKREYWKSVDEYLEKANEDKKPEERIELLKAFLETADFSMLRRQSEKHIVDGNQVTFKLSMKYGEPCYEMTLEHKP